MRSRGGWGPHHPSAELGPDQGLAPTLTVSPAVSSTLRRRALEVRGGGPGQGPQQWPHPSLACVTVGRGPRDSGR